MVRSVNKSTVGYIAVVAALSITSVFSFGLYSRQREAVDSVEIKDFPHTIRDWEGEDLDITENEYRILETRNLIVREYKNDRDEKIYLFIIYSETNRSVFHPPEVCLIGSGVNMVEKIYEDIKSPYGVFKCNKLYLEKKGARDISLYCYKTGRTYTFNYYLQQALFTINQLFAKNKGGATIKVSTRVSDNEEETLETLKSFMEEVIVIMENMRKG
ncbi:MAG: EpsI family protein [Candidatus Omnitrophica bacterium]|nr:EpsI family protein [Candidatus Omnitrophota bacterium]